MCSWPHVVTCSLLQGPVASLKAYLGIVKEGELDFALGQKLGLFLKLPQHSIPPGNRYPGISNLCVKDTWVQIPLDNV